MPADHQTNLDELTRHVAEIAAVVAELPLRMPWRRPWIHQGRYEASEYKALEEEFAKIQDTLARLSPPSLWCCSYAAGMSKTPCGRTLNELTWDVAEITDLVAGLTRRIPRSHLGEHEALGECFTKMMHILARLNPPKHKAWREHDEEMSRSLKELRERGRPKS